MLKLFVDGVQLLALTDEMVHARHLGKDRLDSERRNRLIRMD